MKNKRITNNNKRNILASVKCKCLFYYFYFFSFFSFFVISLKMWSPAIRQTMKCIYYMFKPNIYYKIWINKIWLRWKHSRKRKSTNITVPLCIRFIHSWCVFCHSFLMRFNLNMPFSIKRKKKSKTSDFIVLFTKEKMANDEEKKKLSNRLWYSGHSLNQHHNSFFCFVRCVFLCLNGIFFFFSSFDYIYFAR